MDGAKGKLRDALDSIMRATPNDHDHYASKARETREIAEGLAPGARRVELLHVADAYDGLAHRCRAGREVGRPRGRRGVPNMDGSDALPSKRC